MPRGRDDRGDQELGHGDAGIELTSTSFVFLTPNADLGTRRSLVTTNATDNTFMIRVSTAVMTDLQVGWLLLGSARGKATRHPRPGPPAPPRLDHGLAPPEERTVVVPDSRW